MTQDLLQPQLSGWATCWMHVATELDTAQFASRRKPINKIQAFEDVFGRLESSSPSAQWAALLHTATIDLATARTIEPHLDALTILSEVWSTAPEPDTYWGVYAAEVPDSGLVAERSQGQTFELTGEKRWCSLATELTHAIVTAEVDDNRQAFAIHLQKPDVTHSEEVWNSEGLNEIPSGSIQCHNSPAKPVGEPGWYLERQGFWTGAIRVAACWLGGAIGMAQSAAEKHSGRPQPSPLGNLTLGRIDAEIYAGVSMLVHAATIIEAADDLDINEHRKLAFRVRNGIYRIAQKIQQLSKELAGPTTLTQDQHFTKTDADLSVYLSQHHGVRDEAELGQLLGNKP